jgi:hypothetical protein
MAIEALFKLTADTAQADAAIDSVVQKESQIGKEKAKIAVDTSGAEHSLEGLKEKAKSALSGLGAGFLAGGAAIGLDKSLEAAKQNIQSQEDLKIALRNTGAAGDALNKSFSESESTVVSLSDKYAKGKEAIRGIVTEIAGVGGVSGDQAKKLTEVGLAFEQIGIPAKALKGVIRGAVDPESAAALDALKSKFPQLGVALAGATDTAGKMDAVFKAVQPTLEGMKDAANGPLGQMDKMEETGKNLEISFGSLIFGVLTPFIPIVTGIGSAINDIVIPAFTAVTGFIDRNKVAIGILALGVGALTIAMNTAAIATAAKAVIDKGAIVWTDGLAIAQKAYNLALKDNPIGWVITAVVLLAGAAAFLYDKVDFVKTGVDGLWSILKGVGAFIGAFVSNEIGALVKGFEGAAKVLDGIIHLNLSEVKSGVADVGSAIGTGMSAGKAGVVAFNQSIAESKKSLDDQKKSAKDAGDAAQDGAKRSADAQAALVKGIQDANDAYAGQIKGLDDDYNLAKATFLRVQNDIRNGYTVTDGVRHDLSEAELADYKSKAAQFIALAKDRAARSKDAAKEGASFDAATGKTVAKTSGDPLALSKELADAEAKRIEIKLRLADAEKGIAFSSRDELAVEKARTDEFNKQIKDRDLLASKKYGTKAQAEVDTNTTKTLEIGAKIVVDDKKSQEDYDKAIASLTQKKIELGILPKTDGIKIIDGEIDKLQQKIVVLRAQSILNPLDPKIKTDLAALNEQLLGLSKDRNDKQKALDDELSQARIANITNETDRELAERGRQFASDLQFVRDASDAGRELDAQEIELKKQLETKYYSDIAAIRAKANKSDYDQELDLKRNLTQIAFNDVISSLQQEFNAKKAFNRAAYDAQKQSLDKEQTALQNNLQKGQLTQQEYQTKLALLNQKRVDLEKTQESGLAGAIVGFSQKALGSILDNYEKYFQGLLQKYVFDVALFGQAETEKTLSAVDGATARATADGVSSTASQKDASSSILGAASNALAKGIASLPFPVNIAAGIAASFAVMEAFKGIKSVLGFETGGIGMVGEKGPEIIGPTKDFSQMVSLLVTSTALEVRRAMGQDQATTRRTANRQTVRVTGEFRTRGRDMVTTLNNESLATQNERLAVA